MFYFSIVNRLSQPTGGNDSMKLGGGSSYPKVNGGAPNASFMADSVGGSNSGTHLKQLLPDSIDSQTNGKLAGADDVSTFIVCL